MSDNIQKAGEKGNLLLGVLLIIVALMVIPLLIQFLIPGADIIFRVVLIFSIYSFVTQLMQNNNTLSLLITGVLVYFMVFKYGDVFVSLWFVTTVFTLTNGTLIVTFAKDFLGFGEPHGGGEEHLHPPH